jgi:putative FmdB family regulatory protein
MEADCEGSARKTMPLYDYRCHQCGETFEVRQHFADALLTVHDGCGGELERLISLSALQFKGTGWYVTDYGHNGKVPAAGPNGKSETKSESHGESKSESKTESKSEAKSDSKSESKSETKSDSKSESKPAPASPSSSK